MWDAPPSLLIVKLRALSIDRSYFPITYRVGGPMSIFCDFLPGFKKLSTFVENRTLCYEKHGVWLSVLYVLYVFDSGKKHVLLIRRGIC